MDEQLDCDFTWNRRRGVDLLSTAPTASSCHDKSSCIDTDRAPGDLPEHASQCVEGGNRITACSTTRVSTWCPPTTRLADDSVSSVGSSCNGSSGLLPRWSCDAFAGHLVQSPLHLAQAEACDCEDVFAEESTITCWLQSLPGEQCDKQSTGTGGSANRANHPASAGLNWLDHMGDAGTGVGVAGSDEAVDNRLHHTSACFGSVKVGGPCPSLTPPPRLPAKPLRRAYSDLLAVSLRSRVSAFACDHRTALTVSEGKAAGSVGCAHPSLQQAGDEVARRACSLQRRCSWSCPHGGLLSSDGCSDHDTGDTSHRSGCLGGSTSDLCGAPNSPAVMLRSRSNYHLTSRHATVELFLRLNHARQTLDYVKRQASAFSSLDKTSLSVWEALSQLNELHDYEATLMRNDLSPEMPLLAHAFQTAELCRLRHPELDWLHLVGLIHGLGKLLAHGRWGSQPQWAISGESFPVGCRFSTQVEGAEFFMANPDRRRRQLNTPCGMYAEHCGLTNVYMSWSAAEYLYLVLALNDTSLPPEALFIIRHQKFWTLLSEGCSGYAQLLSADDKRMLPLLSEFQKLSRYHDVGQLPAGALQGAELRKYYSGLIAKYLGGGKLCW